MSDVVIPEGKPIEGREPLDLNFALTAILSTALASPSASPPAHREVTEHQVVSIPGNGSTGPFRVDATEVTIAQFEEFVAAGGYENDALWGSGGLEWLSSQNHASNPDKRRSGRPPHHPVVAVSWYEADAYCRWRGGSLPSDEQWTAAVCGDNAPFPWGEGEPESQGRQAGRTGPTWFANGKYGRINRVATNPATVQRSDLVGPHGLLHGAGNVWEWSSTPYSPNSSHMTLRGGSYMNLPSYCRCDHREPARPSDQRLTAGFRCAY